MVQRLDFQPRRALHRPHILYNQIRRHVARGDDTADAVLIRHQIHQRAAVDFGDHFTVPAALPRRAHAHENIRLVKTGNRHKGVCLPDALFPQ